MHHLAFIPIAFIGLLLFPFVFLFGLLATIFWLWMLIEAATKEPNQGNEKIVWVLVILFTHCLGALLYLLVRRPERIRICGR